MPGGWGTDRPRGGPRSVAIPRAAVARPGKTCPGASDRGEEPTPQPLPTFGCNRKSPNIMCLPDEGQTNHARGRRSQPRTLRGWTPRPSATSVNAWSTTRPRKVEAPLLEPHEIRLRGGWECREGEDPTAKAVRLTLPMRWESVPPGRLRLSRRFQRPPRAPDALAVLRIRQAPGIRSIRFNGTPLDVPPPEIHNHDVALGRLAPWNELVLLVDPPIDGLDWGSLSLLFGLDPSAAEPLAAGIDRLSPGEEGPDDLE